MTYIRLLISVLMALSAATLRAEDHGLVRSGVVTHVTDGDTLWIDVEGPAAKPWKVRLRSVDAPEICQAGGIQAKNALLARVLRREVRFRSVARDDYRRVVADVWLGNEDIGAWLVAQGHAWGSGYRSVRSRYAQEEQRARAARRGVFADPAALEPRVFRKLYGSCRR
jgi:endonuclease YncB( thermonuclease family)